MSDDSVESEVASGPPGPGVKRTFTPGGVTQTITPPPTVVPTHGKAKRIAEKLRNMAKQQAAEQEEGGEDAKNTSEEDTQPIKVPGEVGDSVSEEQKGAESPSEGENRANDEEKLEVSNTDAVKPGETEKGKDLKAQFAALSRAERRLRDDRKAWDEQQKAATAELSSLKELKQIAARDKYQLLDHLGVDINEWAKKKLGQGDTPQEAGMSSEVMQRLEALESRNKELETQKAHQDQQMQYQSQRQNAVAQIGELLQTDGDRFELTKLRGGADVVWATIEEHFHQTGGDLLGFSEAADLVESHFEAEAESYLKAEKLKKKFSSQDEPTGASKVTPDSGAQVTSKPRKNLNHAADRVPSAGLSKRQRRERAIAALKAGQP